MINIFAINLNFVLMNLLIDNFFKSCGDLKRYYSFYSNFLSKYGSNILLLAIRISVGLLFFNRGLIKIADIDKIIILFKYEYDIDFMSPIVGSYLAIFIELIFGAAIIIGFITKLAAIPIIFMILFILNVTWLIARVIDSLIEEYIVPIVTKSESDLDDQLLPILRKTIKAVLWIFGIVIALSNSGFDVAALIAGLGIGGLALALAAQDTVKNIFGGIMVFLDKPFKIKDRIKVNGMDGVVEEIGVRSTRLRTLEGRLITIPNGQFSDNAVENVSLEPTRKVNISLGLTYDTTPEQMENAMNIIKDIIKANSKVEDDALVAFNAWGDFAMGIQVIYYISSPDFIFSAQSEINLEILKLFNAEGLEFAFPTQTIYKKEL